MMFLSEHDSELCYLIAVSTETNRFEEQVMNVSHAYSSYGYGSWISRQLQKILTQPRESTKENES